MDRQRDEIYDENCLDTFYVEDFHSEIIKHGLTFKVWNLKQVPRYHKDKSGPSYGTDIYFGDELIHTHIGNYKLILNDIKWLDYLMKSSLNKKMKL
jgi:hypothetical protein